MCVLSLQTVIPTHLLIIMLSFNRYIYLLIYRSGTCRLSFIRLTQLDMQLDSVNYRLSPTFHSNAISLRAIILQTSSFHQSIAHPFVILETKFYVNDVITASVTCKKLAHVIYQLPATVIYYRPPIHFPISFIGQCLNFVP